DTTEAMLMITPLPRAISRGLRVVLRQRKGNIRTALLRLEISCIVRCNDDVLSAVDHVGCRCCGTRIRQNVIPQQRARLAVEGAEFMVVDRGSDEQQAT